ncbi:MAG TPA: SH3 domain-containing protein [Bacteroidota bacterium]|nr:SH3 domain-containing protein [Bacteroidota bacterium]
MIKGLVLLFLVNQAFAQEASLQLNQANQLYRESQYEKAIALYEQIASNGYEDGALYYNLGNAYYKLKNIPAAILNFERAKRLAPHDDDILYNLRLANIRVTDKIEPVPRLFIIEWWNSFIGTFSTGIWAVVAIVALWCAALGAILFRISKSTLGQRVGFLVCALCIIVSIIGYIGVGQQYRKEYIDQAGIIFSPTVAVKSSPDAQSTDLFVLHEGVRVDVLDTVGDWKKIRLADGKVGWMTSADLRVI